MSRQEFTDTWLVEMPQGLGSFDTYDMIVYNIKDLIAHGQQPVDLGNGYMRIELPNSVYYWYQDGRGAVILGVELDRRPQALVVRLTGKNPSYRGKRPWASDLYRTILADNQKDSIRLMSDVSLSDEGLSIWSRLLDSGANISVYDSESPGKTFKTIDSKEELHQFFGDDDTDYRRYQYVLSNSGTMLAETRSWFHIRRFRETIPGML